jgi:hypothetical protein
MSFYKLVGISGVLLIIGGYYLLWVPVEAELYEVIYRTRIAIMMNLFGSIMAIYYLYKR